MTPRTFEEWEAMPLQGAERRAAFQWLPPVEQAKLATPEQKAAYEAYDRYLALAHAEYDKLAPLIRQDAIGNAMVIMARVHAANVLRCSIVGLPTPTLESTFGHRRPFELFDQRLIDTCIGQIRKEMFPT